MKKNAVLYLLLGLFLAPLALVCAFAAVSAFATRKYEYMPQSLDFIKDMFFYLSAWLLDFSVFFCVGGFVYSVYRKSAVSSAICALITLFHAFLTPMAVFLIRSLFLADVCSSAEMEAYWTNDVITSQSNTITATAAILIALAAALVYAIRAKDDAFERPYVLPKSLPSAAALAFCAAYLLFAVLSFTLGGEYHVPSLLIQAAVIVIEYFVIVLGAYCGKRVEDASSENNQA